jgi:hypothetical protein
MVDIAPLARVMSEQSATLGRLLLNVRGLELMVTASEAAFLALAADETSLLLSELSALELARAVATESLAASLGLMGSDPSLDEIVAALPESEGAVIAHLGAALRAQAAEYAAITSGGVRQLIDGRLGALDVALDRVSSGDAFASDYGDSSSPALSVPAVRFDVGV